MTHTRSCDGDAVCYCYTLPVIPTQPGATLPVPTGWQGGKARQRGSAMTVWCVTVLECVRAPTAKRLLLQLLVLIRIHGARYNATQQPNLTSTPHHHHHGLTPSLADLSYYYSHSCEPRSPRLCGAAEYWVNVEEASAKMEFFVLWEM